MAALGARNRAQQVYSSPDRSRYRVWETAGGDVMTVPVVHLGVITSSRPSSASAVPGRGRGARRRSVSVGKQRVANEVAYGGRSDLLDWVNGFLNLSLSSIEQCRTGAVYCQLLDALFPGDVDMRHVSTDDDDPRAALANMRVVQRVLAKHDIHRDVPIAEIVAGRTKDNLEFLQWLRMLFRLRYRGAPYDAEGRRKLSTRRKYRRRAPSVPPAASTATVMSCRVFVGAPDEFGRVVDGRLVDARLNGPVDVVVDRSAHLVYVCEFGSHSIRRVDLDACKVDTLIGRAGFGDADGDRNDGQLACPLALAVCPDSRRLYIADAAFHLVRVLDLFTNHLTTMVSSGLNQPSALLADGPDRLLIADRAAIHVVDTNLRNGVAPRHVVNLQRPSDLAWLHHRVLLVVEQDAHRVVELDLRSSSVEARAFCGSGTAGFLDGPALSARFNRPQRLAVTKDAVLVTDLNNAVRRLTLSTGVVDTIATGIDFPGGIAVLDANRILVADSAGNCIRDVVEGGAPRRRRNSVPKDRVDDDDGTGVIVEHVRRLAVTGAGDDGVRSAANAICMAIVGHDGLHDVQSTSLARRFLLGADLQSRLRRALRDRATIRSRRDDILAMSNRVEDGPLRRFLIKSVAGE